jgi:hypothetical protein
MKDSSLGTVGITEKQDPSKGFANTKSLRPRPCKPPPPPAYMLGNNYIMSADMVLPTVISKDLFIVPFCTVNATKHSPIIN